MRALGIVLLLAVLAGCGGEMFGAGVDPKAREVKLSEVLLSPELVGKRVTVKGKIGSQCMSNGCWFIMQDESGQVFVNLAPKNFSIPARAGRKAVVTGTVVVDANGYQLIAEGVEVR